MPKEQKYISVTRSYSRKIQLDNYGIPGHKYEPVDFFASYGREVPDETSSKDLQVVSEALYAMAKLDVENAITLYLNELKAWL